MATKKISLVVILLLCSFAGFSQQRIKVIAYNVRSFIGAANDDHIDQGFKTEPFAELLEQHDADVIALNEVETLTSRLQQDGKDREIIAELAYHLGMFPLFGYSYALSNKDGSLSEDRYTYCNMDMYGNAILSKYPILNSYSYLLPRPSGSSDQRSAVWADILLPGNKVVRIACTHLDHTGGRAEQAKELVSDENGMLDTDNPIILMGDFNTSTSSSELSSSVKPLFDVIYSGGIDHIYLSKNGGSKVSGRTIYSSLSDHNPICAEIDLTF